MASLSGVGGRGALDDLCYVCWQRRRLCRIGEIVPARLSFLNRSFEGRCGWQFLSLGEVCRGRVYRVVDPPTQLH